MKRKSSRAWPLSARVVKPIDKLNPNLFRFPSASEHSGVRVRKIVVIKEVQRWPATTAAGRKIQRILVFDNHPESLRLLLGSRAKPDVDPSFPPPPSWSEPALFWMLMFSVFTLMLWPLF
jgi:hypothetical protein